MDRLRQRVRGRRESRMDFSLIRSHVSWCGLAWLDNDESSSPSRARENRGEGGKEREGEGDKRRKRWNEARGGGHKVQGRGQVEMEGEGTVVVVVRGKNTLHILCCFLHSRLFFKINIRKNNSRNFTFHSLKWGQISSKARHMALNSVWISVYVDEWIRKSIISV